jgi:putative SOS response-associated peptidase YedK
VLTPLSGTSDAPMNDAQNDVAATSDDTTFQGLLQLNFIFTEPPTKKIIEKLAKGLNRAMKIEKMPVSRIAWGGLSSWEDPQLTTNGRAHMIKAASKFRKAVLNRRLKRGSQLRNNAQGLGQSDLLL